MTVRFSKNYLWFLKYQLYNIVIHNTDKNYAIKNIKITNTHQYYEYQYYATRYKITNRN